MRQVLEYHLDQEVGDSPPGSGGGCFPLHYAIRAKSGRAQTREQFIHRSIHDACPNTAKGKLEELYEAIGCNLVGFIELLLGAGRINANDPDHDQRTPLSYAAEFGDKETVQHLLRIGSVIKNAPDKQKRTPLSYAVACGHAEVERLLRSSSNIDTKAGEIEGRPPLSHTVKPLLQDGQGEESDTGETAPLSNAALHDASLDAACHAFQNGDVSASQKILNSILGV